MEGLNSSFQWDNHTQPVKMAATQMSTPRPTPFFFQQELSYSTKKVCWCSLCLVKQFNCFYLFCLNDLFQPTKADSGEVPDFAEGKQK